MKILAGFFLLVTFLGAVCAQSQDKKFNPHMIDHEIEGCPENSHCSKKMGAQRLKWVQLLKRHQAGGNPNIIEDIESFRREHGLLIPMWGFAAGLKDENLISWNSSCPHHNLETREVFHVLKMIKSFNELEEHNLHQEEIDKKIKATPQKVWLEDQAGEVVEYRIPRGFRPSLVIDSQLYFTMEEKGIYYGLLVDRDGDFKVVPTQSSPVKGKEVPCSKSLKTHYKNWPLKDRLYQDSYCRAIWDQKRETYQVFMIGWSCP